MVTRNCPHCQSEIRLEQEGASCPACGLDPELPTLAFDDAPAFFIGGDPRHDGVAVGMGTETVSGG